MEIKKVGDLASLIKEGDIVGIFGPAGAGKTSFALRICNEMGKKNYYTKYFSTEHPSFEIDFILAKWNLNPSYFEIYDKFEEVKVKGEGISVEGVIGKKKKQVLVIDSITSLLLPETFLKEKMDMKRVLEIIESIRKEVREGGILIMTIDTQLLPIEVLEKLKEMCTVKIEIEDAGEYKFVKVNTAEVSFSGYVNKKGEFEWK